MTGEAASKLMVGDVNGDGRTDIIYPYTESSALKVRVKFSNGDGTFTATQFVLGDGMTGEAVPKLMLGDVNGDGRTDIIYPYTEAYQLHVRVKFSNGDGTFTATHNFLGDGMHGEVVPQLLPGDVDGDGKTDLIYPYIEDNKL